MRKKAGFTLIELSIVLVIIGLIVGGVLVGQDLIQAAKIRSTATQSQQFQTAINTFRLKYNCYPGDCRNATTFGFTNNGTGDKIAVDGPEGLWVWTHLGQAGLIDGQYDGLWDGDVNVGESYPRSKLKDNVGWRFGYFASPGGIWPHSPSGREYVFLGTSIGNYYTGFDVMTPLEAYQLDQKIDDGLPKSGRVIAPVWGACIDVATDLYFVTATDIHCAPGYVLDW